MDPWGIGGVLTGHAAPSWSPEISAGVAEVVHTTMDSWPGRLEILLVGWSSMVTTARPWESCPVTTRRRFSTTIASFPAG